MNLSQLKANGGFIDTQQVRKELNWTHPDPHSGEPVTDVLVVQVRRQSFGVIERLFVAGEGEQSRNARFIAASVSLGEDGEEELSYEDAYSLDPGLGFLILNAVNEVNGTGGSPAKR
ncbi:phage tail assembly chaperone family protein, TAC [Pseudomonas sp. RIT-To-2]|uniref:phage tail assembly chaperone family protein, TAC n=1 Tax=Pseudomonas sp. RIT-To-2 TaxID=3462541 RepID=UPI002413AD7D